MEYDATNTKMKLLEAAGELFAEQGLEGTSVRQIAAKAGANVASVNYHFGSKQNLYTELMRYLCNMEHKNRIQTIQQENPEWLETREGHARIIHELVRSQIAHVLDPDHPDWHSKLWLKEITQPTEALDILMEEYFKPERDRFIELVKKIKPGITELEAAYWHMFMPAHMLLYSLAQEPIFKLSEMDEFTPEFVNSMIYFASKALIQGLDLPYPGDLHITLQPE